MDKLKVEKATKEQSEIIANLIYETEKYPNEEWGNGTKAEHLERLMSLIKEEDNRFSYNNIITLKNGTKLIGIALYLKGDKLKNQTLKADIKLVPMQKGIKNKLRIIFLAGCYYFDKECEKDEIYLSNIIIGQKYRGKGLSSILLDEVLNIGVENGFKKISIRANNKKLVAFYQSVGFELIKDDKLIKYV